MIAASALTPLLLMWILSGSSSRSQPSSSAPAPAGKPKKKPKPPSWPTTSSPPPVPAFVPNPPAPPAPPTAEPATSLATLNRRARAPARKAPPKQSAAQQALQAAQSGRIPGVKLPGGLRLPGFGLSIPGFSASSTPMKVASVRELQGMVNTWGGTLALDGKYGPKTAAAWQALAKKNSLPPEIARNGPTTAKVAVQTFDALNVPNIP